MLASGSTVNGGLWGSHEGGAVFNSKEHSHITLRYSRSLQNALEGGLMDTIIDDDRSHK